MNSAQRLITIMTLSSETSTATWAVLMVVVGASVSAIIAGWRMNTNKVSKVEDQLKAAEDKVSDTRHSELKTMISGVSESVRDMNSRMDGFERKVNTLQRGHAVIKAHLGLNVNGEDPE